MPTFTLLQKQSRDGIFTSPDVTIGANPPRRVTGTVLIDLADMADPAVQVSMSVWVSANGGASWQSIGGCAWAGGPQTQKNDVIPAWACTIDDLPAHGGKRIRGEFSVSPRTSVGLSITI